MIKQIIINYEEHTSSDELTSVDADLLRAARAATLKAYAPYSHFYVGAAVLLENGDIYSASNQENASFPVSTCAEQVVFMGLTTVLEEFKAISLAVSYSNQVGPSNSPISPCGKCRQFLSEFEARMKTPIRIIMAGQNGKVQIVHSVKELMPLAFGSGDLAK